MKRKGKREESAAVLTIRRPAAMTPKDARQVAAWLRKQAGYLESKQEREALADGYRARYLYA